MSIATKHYYHGAALSLITAAGKFTGLGRLNEFGAAAYAVNHNMGIFLKHTEKESSPWTFNFAPDHQRAVKQLHKRYGDRAFIVLICPPSGVCLLTFGEYQAIIDETFNEQQNVVVRKPTNGGFRVSGRQGDLNSIVPINRFPEKLF